MSVSFSASMNLTITKEAFLSDTSNKQRFVTLLGEQLEGSGCQVFHRKGHADVLIVLKALELANTKDTVLIGDDTDLLVLLLSKDMPQSSKKIFFAPEPKKIHSKTRIWDIKQVKVDLGSFICQHLLFLHALSGCDTTTVIPRLYGIGKGTILKKLKNNIILQQAALVFHNPMSTHTQVQEAGEKALVAIYNGKNSDSLNMLRYKRYSEKVAASASQVDPKNLPPTSPAAKYHSFRVFLQVDQWIDTECDA